jgi:glycosyltransferase involved in cell wall biosynthesis
VTDSALELQRLPPIKAAVVHDWFAGLYGSERVVETMRTGLFDPSTPPDVLTFHAAHEVLPPELNAAITRESRLAALPGLRQRGHERGRFRYLLPYMPVYFRHLDLSEYDLVIASSHACAINARPPRDCLYICYSHTPMRYVWLPGLEHERLRGAKGMGLRMLGAYLRRADRAAARRPDAFVANSTAVRDRIRRFYGRDAEVIPPPVDVENLDSGAEKDPARFLWVHRLIDYKQPELVMEAFRGLPYRLTMVGIGPLEDRLRSRLPANVELRGWTPQAELDELYAQSSGFIHVAEEDFGIGIVEALAAGTPVIGLNRGGARDIVRPQIDGLLLDEPSLGGLRTAIESLASMSWDREALVEQSREFSRDRFLSRMSAYVRRLRSESGKSPRPPQLKEK